MQHQAYVTARSFVMYGKNEKVDEVFTAHEIVQIKIPADFMVRKNVTLFSLRKGGSKYTMSMQEFLNLKEEGALIVKPQRKKGLKLPVW